MNLLIVAATEQEIRPTIDYLEKGRPAGANSYVKNIGVCITGVGATATTYALGKALQNVQCDFALQVGVCGAYDRRLALADLVCINSEQFGDLGAEDHDNYLDISDLGLQDKNAFPFKNSKLLTSGQSMLFLDRLPWVSGLTVNTVSGSEHTIKMRSEKFACQVESMEGAAFHYVCINEQKPFAQVRSISNYVEPRDKSKWQIKEAIITLNKWLIEFLEQQNN